MLMTKRKPATVGEILVQEFMEPMGLTQSALAKAMGVQRKHVNELCNDRRAVTAPTALILARVFGNSPDFWLNVQRRSDIWQAMHSPRERERIRRARPIGAAAWCRCPAHHLKFGYEIPLYRTNLQSGAPDAIRPHG
jgi:antitoxin HigA-1